MKKITILPLVVATLGSALGAAEYLVYFGTFTDGAARGIYVSRMDVATGSLSAPELAMEVPSPNYLAVSPDGRFLFAATRPNGPGGAVSSYAITRPSGRLELVDEKFAGGAGPCHVSIDTTGRTVLVANYSGGSVKSFRTGPDGRLTDGTFAQHEGRSVNPSRQRGPHAHCFVTAPQGGFALACDLGTDRIMNYRLDPADASLVANEPAYAVVPPGSGPRHLVFSADGTRVYVVNEMTCTLSTFAWDASRGALDARETISLLPAGVEIESSFSAAAIVASPDGRFVFATVRGHNSVSVFATGTDGALSLIENVPCGGETPRGLGIDPTGRWLLVGNQKSNSVAVFAIDMTTGRLTATEHTVSVGSPVDVRFVSAVLAQPSN
ncbi:MAG TPA: lactonase family protein [Opitutaceae bacterium]|nr:lactonase family protein [Opitutaceae bacterium]